MSRRKSLNRRRSWRKSNNQSQFLNEDSEVFTENLDNVRWYENSVVQNSVRFSNSLRASTFLNSKSFVDDSSVSDKWYDNLPQNEESLNLQSRAAKKQATRTSSPPGAVVSSDNVKTSSDTESEKGASRKRFNFRRRGRKSTGIDNYSDAFNETPASVSSPRKKRLRDPEVEQKEVSKKPKKQRSERFAEPSEINETASSIEKTEKVVKRKPFFKKKSVEPADNEFDSAWDESTLEGNISDIRTSKNISNESLPLKKRSYIETFKSPNKSKNRSKEQSLPDESSVVSELPIANDSVMKPTKKSILSAFKNKRQSGQVNSSEESEIVKRVDNVVPLSPKQKSLNVSNHSLKSPARLKSLRSSAHIEALSNTSSTSQKQKDAEKSAFLTPRKRSLRSAIHQETLESLNTSTRSRRKNKSTNPELLNPSNTSSTLKNVSSDVNDARSHIQDKEESINNLRNSVDGNAEVALAENDVNQRKAQESSLSEENKMLENEETSDKNEKILDVLEESSDSEHSYEIPPSQEKSWNKYSLRMSSPEKENEKQMDAPKRRRQNSYTSSNDPFIDIETISNIENQDVNIREKRANISEPMQKSKSNSSGETGIRDVTNKIVNPVEDCDVSAVSYLEDSQDDEVQMSSKKIPEMQLSILNSSKTVISKEKSLRNATKNSIEDSAVESDNEKTLANDAPKKSQIFRKRLPTNDSSTNFDDAFDSESSDNANNSIPSKSLSKNMSRTKKSGTLPLPKKSETLQSNSFRTTDIISQKSPSPASLHLQLENSENGHDDESIKDASNINSVSYTESSGEENLEQSKRISTKQNFESPNLTNENTSLKSPKSNVELQNDSSGSINGRTKLRSSRRLTSPASSPEKQNERAKRSVVGLTSPVSSPEKQNGRAKCTSNELTSPITSPEKQNERAKRSVVGLTSPISSPEKQNGRVKRTSNELTSPITSPEKQNGRAKRSVVGLTSPVSSPEKQNGRAKQRSSHGLTSPVSSPEKENESANQRSAVGLTSPVSSPEKQHSAHVLTSPISSPEKQNGRLKQRSSRGLTSLVSSPEKQNGRAKQRSSHRLTSPVSSPEKQKRSAKQRSSRRLTSLVSSPEEENGRAKQRSAVGLTSPVSSPEKQNRRDKQRSSHRLTSPVSSPENENESAKQRSAVGLTSPASSPEEENGRTQQRSSDVLTSPASSPEKQNESAKERSAVGLTSPVSSPEEENRRAKQRSSHRLTSPLSSPEKQNESAKQRSAHVLTLPISSPEKQNGRLKQRSSRRLTSLVSSPEEESGRAKQRSSRRLTSPVSSPEEENGRTKQRSSDVLTSPASSPEKQNGRAKQRSSHRLTSPVSSPDKQNESAKQRSAVGLTSPVSSPDEENGRTKQRSAVGLTSPVSSPEEENGRTKQRSSDVLTSPASSPKKQNESAKQDSAHVLTSPTSSPEIQNRRSNRSAVKLTSPISSPEKQNERPKHTSNSLTSPISSPEIKNRRSNRSAVRLTSPTSSPGKQNRKTKQHSSETLTTPPSSPEIKNRRSNRSAVRLTSPISSPEKQNGRTKQTSNGLTSPISSSEKQNGRTKQTSDELTSPISPATRNRTVRNLASELNSSDRSEVNDERSKIQKSKKKTSENVSESESSEIENTPLENRNKSKSTKNSSMVEGNLESEEITSKTPSAIIPESESFEVENVLPTQESISQSILADWESVNSENVNEDSENNVTNKSSKETSTPVETQLAKKSVQEKTITSKHKNLLNNDGNESSQSTGAISSVSFTEDSQENSPVSNKSVSKEAKIDEQKKSTLTEPDVSKINALEISSTVERNKKTHNSSANFNDEDESIIAHGDAQSTLMPIGKPLNRYSRLPIIDNDYTSDLTEEAAQVPEIPKENSKTVKNIQDEPASVTSDESISPLITRSRQDIPDDASERNKIAELPKVPGPTKKLQTNILDYFTKGNVVAEDLWQKAKQKTDEMQKKAHIYIEKDSIVTREEKKSFKFRKPVLNTQKPKKPPKLVDKAHMVNGTPYKQPKLFQPKPWVTLKLYKYLWKHLEPKYGTAARVRSEEFIRKLSEVVSLVERRKMYENYKVQLKSIMIEMARLGLIKTRDDFYAFCREFIPYSFRKKAVPMLLPGNIHSIPFDPNLLHVPLLKDK